MDELKFQVWDERHKIMYTEVAIYDGGQRVGLDDSEHRYEEHEPHVEFGEYGWVYLVDDFYIRQFTTKKDARGNDIFDGDIIELYGAKYVVEFFDAGFVANNINPNGMLDMTALPYVWDACEIVGNKYQNPELLAEHSPSC